MKAKTTNYIRTTMLLVVFGVMISVTGASGQTSTTIFAGKFTLGHQVRWGQAILPPGGYSIRFTSSHSPATVRSLDGKTMAFVFTSRSGDSEKGPSSLTIVTRGSERIVSSMNLPSSGLSLIYSPLTKAEREDLARQKQIENVPLVAANK